MVYLTDHIIGVEPFERVSKELCAYLVQNTASMSMQKAVNATGVVVSRQTVNNKILAMRDTVTEIRLPGAKKVSKKWQCSVFLRKTAAK